MEPDLIERLNKFKTFIIAKKRILSQISFLFLSDLVSDQNIYYHHWIEQFSPDQGSSLQR